MPENSSANPGEGWRVNRIFPVFFRARGLSLMPPGLEAKRLPCIVMTPPLLQASGRSNRPCGMTVFNDHQDGRTGPAQKDGVCHDGWTVKMARAALSSARIQRRLCDCRRAPCWLHPGRFTRGPGCQSTSDVDLLSNRTIGRSVTDFPRPSIVSYPSGSRLIVVVSRPSRLRTSCRARKSRFSG